MHLEWKWNANHVIKKCAKIVIKLWWVVITYSECQKNDLEKGAKHNDEVKEFYLSFIFINSH
jgi:hypothetical protein